MDKEHLTIASSWCGSFRAFLDRLVPELPWLKFYRQPSRKLHQGWTCRLLPESERKDKLKWGLATKVTWERTRIQVGDLGEIPGLHGEWLKEAPQAIFKGYEGQACFWILLTSWYGLAASRHETAARQPPSETNCAEFRSDLPWYENHGQALLWWKTYIKTVAAAHIKKSLHCHGAPLSVMEVSKGRLNLYKNALCSRAAWITWIT